MVKVKIIQAATYRLLEQRINEFLDTFNNDKNVHEISFPTSLRNWYAVVKYVDETLTEKKRQRLKL